MCAGIELCWIKPAPLCSILSTLWRWNDRKCGVVAFPLQWRLTNAVFASVDDKIEATQRSANVVIPSHCSPCIPQFELEVEVVVERIAITLARVYGSRMWRKR